MNIGGKNLKCARYDCISKAIKDHINFHTLVGFTCEFLLKLLTYLVAFPDVRFKINTLLSSVNCAQHSFVQVMSIIINLDGILSDFYFLQ